MNQKDKNLLKGGKKEEKEKEKTIFTRTQRLVFVL